MNQSSYGKKNWHNALGTMVIRGGAQAGPLVQLSAKPVSNHLAGGTVLGCILVHWARRHFLPNQSTLNELREAGEVLEATMPYVLSVF